MSDYGEGVIVGLDGRIKKTVKFGDSGRVLRLSPDGSLVGTTDFEGVLYDLDGQEVANFGDFEIAAFSPDSSLLGTTDSNYQTGIVTMIFRNRAGEEIWRWNAFKPAYIYGFSGDSTQALLSIDQKLAWWPIGGGSSTPLEVEAGRSYHPAGLAVGSNHVATHADTETEEETTPRQPETVLFDGEGKAVTRVVGERFLGFAPDSSSFLTYREDVVTLRALDGTVLAVLANHGDQPHHGVISPTLDMIAISCADDSIHLWTMDGQRTAILASRRDTIQYSNPENIVFSPDGRWLLDNRMSDERARLYMVRSEDILARALELREDMRLFERSF